MKRPTAIATILALALAALPSPGNVTAAPAAAPADELTAAWDRLVSMYVDDEGLIDYAGLQGAGHDEFRAFMEKLAVADPAQLQSEAEQIAFWINAYNAVVAWQVVDRYPIDSVRDVGALWGLVGGFFKNKYPIAGRQMSADDIEHGTLRADFDDERIHWALVCAAFGCPRLLNRAYRAETLDQTLREQSLEFLARPRGLQLDRASSTLYLSSYFDWYEADFEAAAGDVVDYVLRYAPEPDADWIRTNREAMNIRIMDYDWTLNSQLNGPRSRRPVPRN